MDDRGLPRSILLIALLLTAAVAVFAEVEVMFWDDFENMASGATPALFLPSGTANPDWDNAVLNAFGGTLGWNSIYTGAVSGNATKKYALSPFSGGDTMLLGANFDPSTDRYVVVEYDVNVQGEGKKGRTAEIIYADGYGNLDGTGGTTKIAIHLSFSENSSVSDNAGGANDLIYAIQGEDNSVLTADGFEYSTGVNWTVGGWHHVQVIADQLNRTYDLKITDKAMGYLYTRTGVPFNDASAGYIRKVWLGQTSDYPCFFDNLLVYQNSSVPPAGSPFVILNEYAKGPLKANTGLDVDFVDETDLASIQYRIGASGTWTDLTSDGTTAFDLSGAANTYVTALVWITNSDFAAMAQGASSVYFRATDNVGNITEAVATISLNKDTQAPYLASVTTPASYTISALTSIKGLAADAVSGLAANSMTFTLQRQSDSFYWSGAAWLAAPTNLPTTHAAAAGGATVTWTNAGALPSSPAWK